MQKISRITIYGYKSIKCLESLELKNLNVFLGANGAGKSNFFSLFEFLQQIAQQNLQFYLIKQGGIERFLHYGLKQTQEIKFEIEFSEERTYSLTLEPALKNRLVFSREFLQFQEGKEQKEIRIQEKGNGESELTSHTHPIGKEVLESLKSWKVYHFFDTGETAKMKSLVAVNDNRRFRSDAQNLPAFLYYLKRKHSFYYQAIVETVQLVAPFFGDFFLLPHPDNENLIQLEWTEKGQDFPFLVHDLPDGLLRFICLATLLLQPTELIPEIILIDEPELGLHPFAIHMLGALIKQAALNRQIFISTQSPTLVEEFEPEDLIVVERRQGKSVFSRPDEEEVQEWLEDYTLAELWMKNILGGRPTL